MPGPVDRGRHLQPGTPVLAVTKDVTVWRQAEHGSPVRAGRFSLRLAARTDAFDRVSANRDELRGLVGRDFLAKMPASGRSWLEHCLPVPERRRVTGVVADAIRGRRTLEPTLQVMRVDGTPRRACTRVVPMLDAEGQIFEWFGIARDITDSERVEDGLRRRQIPLAVRVPRRGGRWVQMSFDGRGHPVGLRYLEANPALVGHTCVADPPGRCVREILPAYEDHWVEIYGRTAITGVPDRLEIRAEAMHRWFDADAWRFGHPCDRQAVCR